MEHQAIFETRLHRDENGKLLGTGHSFQGFIFEDKCTHGKHPFPDGRYIYTSVVLDIVEEDDKVYFVTHNTVYLVREIPATIDIQHRMKVDA